MRRTEKSSAMGEARRGIRSTAGTYGPDLGVQDVDVELASKGEEFVYS